MADPFAKERFAASVRRKLDGLSYRQAVDAFPALNVAMLSRAARGEALSVGSFLVVCKALRLPPLSFLEAVKRAPHMSRKAFVKQAVTAFEKRETQEVAPS